MIKLIVLKVTRFFYRILSKIIYLLIPIISKILIALRLNSRIINQLNRLRYESHKTDDHSNLISKLLVDNKLIALDVGAQGGFFESNIFAKKYNNFFDPIVVEPLSNEAEKLSKKNYKVILVPPKIWFSFKSLTKISIVVNCIDNPHSDNETLKSISIKNHKIKN